MQKININYKNSLEKIIKNSYKILKGGKNTLKIRVPHIKIE